MNNELTAHGKPYIEKKYASFWTFSKSGLDPPKKQYYKLPQNHPKSTSKPSQNYLKNIGICHPPVPPKGPRDLGKFQISSDYWKKLAIT